MWLWVSSFTVYVTEWEKHKEHSDLDSLPGSQLACMTLSSFLHSSTPNIFLYVTGLYKAILYKLFTWKHWVRLGKQ